MLLFRVAEKMGNKPHSVWCAYPIVGFRRYPGPEGAWALKCAMPSEAGNAPEDDATIRYYPNAHKGHLEIHVENEDES
ncbi:hypothetical protein COU18_02915 [Candidatus Kaiserbacteria bacterium CG10_big_fil_rev_8_21_14_0_10_51_14]|uniref:Uncharacterized protein n=1 Tax=Candidatus Kaiserbacteria bacterium CG10_big_fil_rev_8_21_14_0_10_51_14 TaxID=1974610 RepID=A0A2H0UB18_9BACT|nr:MAG: hypothetical protein COU18_02915 [Candidatus Kaiserbacteria bacterium CG10_big_fil_rev_8_21_14_0_10_51_14]